MNLIAPDRGDWNDDWATEKLSPGDDQKFCRFRFTESLSKFKLTEFKRFLAEIPQNVRTW